MTKSKNRNNWPEVTENLINNANHEVASVTKQNLAEFLKEMRRSQNLSLEKLSDLTKIQVYHLKALEEDRVNLLPPSVYREGILKRLAKFLNIDEDKIFELYKNENQSTSDPLYADSVVSPKKNINFVLTPAKLTIFMGSLFLMAMSAYLWYQFNFLFGPPTLVVDPKEDVVTATPLIAVKGRTDAGVSLTINGENIYVSSKGDFSKDVQLAAGINVIEIKAVNNLGKTTRIIRQIFRQ